MTRFLGRSRFTLAMLASTGCVTAAAFLLSGVAAAAPAARATAQPKTLILYATAEQEQYVDNSDSLSRGQGNNPFGNYKDLEPLANKNATGPFPGDEALYSFNLFTGPSLTKRAGSAIFTCQYNFNKNAYCDATFHMNNGGTLIASGAFNFSAPKFSLAITGSYGAYVNKRGSMTDVPNPNHAQKLTFTFD